jgi:hypothetical protein
MVILSSDIINIDAPGAEINKLATIQKPECREI